LRLRLTSAQPTRGFGSRAHALRLGSRAGDPDRLATTWGVAGGSGDSFYDAEDVHERYTAQRDGEQHLSPNHVMEEPAVLAEVGDPAGLRILDLGCGDGRFGHRMLMAGARSYQGVDSSLRMIGMAVQNLAGTPGSVRLADIEDVIPAPGSLDIITARLSLHYLADIDPIMKIVAQALATDGRFIFTVVHPVITSYDNQPTGPRTNWTVDDYFNTGPRVRNWLGSNVTWHHRTIEDYVRAVTKAGLTLTALRECEPDPARFDGHTDELARRRRVPLFLLLNTRI
jgi:SAM-dependent methyltransferase